MIVVLLYRTRLHTMALLISLHTSANVFYYWKTTISINDQL